LHIFRHSTQIFLAGRQPACVKFMHSDEKSDCASDAQGLCGIALKGFEKLEHKKAQMAKIGHLRFCYMISKWFFLHRINLSRCILLSSLESTERSTLR